MNIEMIEKSAFNSKTTREAFSFLSSNFVLGLQTTMILSINSFAPGEGKTLTAINLAIASARAGAETLLIDADLRTGDHSKESLKGLSDCSKESSSQNMIIPTSIKGLCYVNAGIKAVDPVEFLSGESFVSFLKDMSDQFDVIILDTPASGKYPDGAIIASKASGALLVTSADKTTYKSIERMKWQMEHVNANIIGIILNKVNRNEYKAYYIAN